MAHGSAAPLGRMFVDGLSGGSRFAAYYAASLHHRLISIQPSGLGADGGVDGKILFRDHPDPKEKPQSIIFSMKGGHLKLDDVRALDSVMTKNGDSIGGLISIEEPTRPMREWAANTGSYTSAFNGQKFPCIQLRTIEQLDGRRRHRAPEWECGRG